MSDDFLHQARQLPNNAARQFDEDIYFHTLRAIDALMATNPHPQSLSDFGLPVPPPLQPYKGNLLVGEERARYDRNHLARVRDECVLKLNPHQREAYDTILHSINRIQQYMAQFYALYGSSGEQTHVYKEYHRVNFPSDISHAFFVDGLGGAGKTFLYNTILSTVRANRGGIGIAVASSGIAALLLEGGRTAHSRFQIPINELDSNSTCCITKQLKQAQFILATNVIIWDEAPMQSKWTFEAVDKTLRDLTGIDKPFGGKVIVMGGDFRQVLPIIAHASRAKTVDAALNRSELWRHIRVLNLHLNMRVQLLLESGDTASANRQANFASWLQRVVGDGTEQTYSIHEDDDMIRIPEELCVGCNKHDHMEQLIEKVYGDLRSIRDWDEKATFVSERSILTPLNKDVDDINEYIGETYFRNEDVS